MSIVKEQLKLFFANPVFIACIFSWLSAQLIKTLVKLFTKKIKTISELFELLFWRTGGMPSSDTDGNNDLRRIMVMAPLRGGENPGSHQLGCAYSLAVRFYL